MCTRVIEQIGDGKEESFRNQASKRVVHNDSQGKDEFWTEYDVRGSDV